MTTFKRLKTRHKRAESPPVNAPHTLRDRVLLAMRRLGIGSARGEGFNALDRLMGKGPGFTSGAIGRTASPRLDSVILLSRALQVRLDWLATGEGPMDVGAAPGSETYGDLPGWAAAAREVRGLPAYAVEAVAARPMLLRPERVTTEFVRALAGFWLSWAPATEIDEAARRDAAARDAGPSSGGRKV